MKRLILLISLFFLLTNSNAQKKLNLIVFQDISLSIPSNNIHMITKEDVLKLIKKSLDLYDEVELAIGTIENKSRLLEVLNFKKEKKHQEIQLKGKTPFLAKIKKEEIEQGNKALNEQNRIILNNNNQSYNKLEALIFNLTSMKKTTYTDIEGALNLSKKLKTDSTKQLIIFVTDGIQDPPKSLPRIDGADFIIVNGNNRATNDLTGFGKEVVYFNQIFDLIK